MIWDFVFLGQKVGSIKGYFMSVYNKYNYQSKEIIQMSRVMRKPAFYTCKKKGTDQLHGNWAADDRLCFRYIDSTITELLKSDISSY